MTVFDIISLLGGLALFLYGMRVMGDGLKKGSSATFKKAIEKVTNSPLVGFITGMLITAIIQSSTATIVIVAGLVGAGILTLHQSIGIILGANVGTTITGQIIRLMDLNAGGSSILKLFQPATLAPLAAIIGIILLMFLRFKNSDTIGSIAIGFGVLFTGLINMTGAVSVLSSSGALEGIITTFASTPILGFIVGFGVSFILQSSSASVGILQTLSMSGKLTFIAVFPILLGIYLGDAITTTIVCSIGSKADPKRVGLIQFLFNICKVIVIVIVLIPLKLFGVLDSLWDSALNSGGIANVNTVFNIASAVVLLPTTGMLERLSMRFVKSDPISERQPAKELAGLDKAFFKSPVLALSSANLVINKMAEMSCASVNLAMDNFINHNQKNVELIHEDENSIDEMADQTNNYLANLLPHIDSGATNDELNYYMTCVNEFERIGDHAMNLTENAMSLIEHGVTFSSVAKEELSVAKDALCEITGYAIEAFRDKNLSAARHIEPIEEVIDDLVSIMRENHLARLKEGKCNVYSGFTFLDALVNIERISDQCSNIGVHTVALYSTETNTSPHDYIKELHQGKDATYNSEYQQAHDFYVGKLKQIIHSSGGKEI